MFKTIKNIYNLAKSIDSPKDIEKIKRVSTRSGTFLTDEDRQRAEEVKQYKAELRKQEYDIKKQELELEKLQRLQELEVRKEELKQLREEITTNKENGGGMEDFLLQQLLTKFMNPQQAQPQTPQPQQFTPQQPVTDEEQPQTRFTDEQLKITLPKLLNQQQIETLKQLNLNDDEILQLGDVIKSM